MISFREAEYVIELADPRKGVVRVVAQLRIDGGALAAVAPNGQLVMAWAPGAWRSVEPA